MRTINYLIKNKILPNWITIKYLPVLPPNLRPIIKLKDNNIITSEINYLYINLINSNKKISKLKKMSIPEKFINKEKKTLQIKLDQIINEKNNGQKFYKQTTLRIIKK